MKNKSFYADLLILRKLFFPNENPLLVVDDKNDFHDAENNIGSFDFKNNDLEQFCNNVNTKFILVNVSGHSLTKFYQSQNLEGIIDFSKKNKKGFFSFYFFNNQDQSIRWIFPKKSNSPSFLNLYNGSGIKATAFKWIAKILHFLGWIKPLTSGQFSIYSKNKNSIATHFGDLKYDDFAIFTGTIGENRKAIIALSEKKRCTQFLKIPLTAASEHLVENEFCQLHHLSGQQFEYLVFPKVQRTPTGVAVSNIQPKRFENNLSFQPIHFKVLNELYRHSFKPKRIRELSVWKTIDEGIRFFQNFKTPNNGLSAEKTKQLQNICERIFYNIDTADSIIVGIGHGDFTPWNMYVKKAKLHLYDWEMCSTTLPLLFDVFHYTFQKGILIERKKVEAIEREIQDILKSSEAMEVISAYQLKWRKYYELYLLYIVCYYFPKYATQPQLHMQVHWLLDGWLAAMQPINTEVKITA